MFLDFMWHASTSRKVYRFWQDNGLIRILQVLIFRLPWHCLSLSLHLSAVWSANHLYCIDMLESSSKIMVHLLQSYSLPDSSISDTWEMSLSRNCQSAKHFIQHQTDLGWYISGTHLQQKSSLLSHSAFCWQPYSGLIIMVRKRMFENDYWLV